MNGIHYLNLLEDGSDSAAAKIIFHKLKNLGNTHSGGIWDPVAVLPPELALACLREALPWSSNYSATLLDLCSVCSRWQDFLLSTPILWSEIHIESSAHDLLAIVALFAHLSSKVRLKLIFWNIPGLEWPAIRSALLPHTHRIDALVLGDKLVVTMEPGYIYTSH
jgi:F-box-like